jgi:hypothetical protein
MTHHQKPFPCPKVFVQLPEHLCLVNEPSAKTYQENQGNAEHSDPLPLTELPVHEKTRKSFAAPVIK